MSAITADVIIVGAGAAGLTAAYDLVGTGLNVIVLEADSRPLGRLKKNDNLASFPLDVGGEWIHVNPSILAQIVDDSSVSLGDIETVPYNPTYHYWDEVEWASEEWSAKSDHKFVGYTWFDFFSDFIQLDNVEVVLNCAVNEIVWDADTVTIACGNRSWNAEKVIITTSIKTLQDDDISFRPVLPDSYASAIQQMTMLAGVKVFFKFTNNFYFYEAFSFSNDDQAGNERFFYDATFGQDTDENILGFFSIGPAAELYVDQSDADIVSSLIAELDFYFENQASSNLESAVVQNWNNEPYIKGAYITISGCQVGPVDVLREPIEDKLFFAGEAIPAGDYEWGFAHGAALSGRRAAELVSKGTGEGPGTLQTIIAVILSILTCSL